MWYNKVYNFQKARLTYHELHLMWRYQDNLRQDYEFLEVLLIPPGDIKVVSEILDLEHY